MRRVWFVSDTHFGHEAILGHCRPQFSSVEEMDEAIVENWCTTVGSGDLVYHLGDFCWSPKDVSKYRARLSGTIRLVVGNHDDVPACCAATGADGRRAFQRVSLWRQFPEYGFVATHVPMRREQLRHARHSVHGHVHGNTTGLEPWHRDVSVESVDYRPIAAERLRQWVIDTAREGFE